MRHDRSWQRVAWQAALLAALLLGFALRLHRLDTASLWLDELGQVSVASGSAAQAIAGARLHHGAAPLDYLLTWLALRVAHVDFAARLPAALLGTLTLALTYRLGRELFDRPTGLLAALLLAIAPLHLRFSQEARFYALFACLAVSATLALILALRYNRARNWALYALLITAGLYSHYYTVLVVLVHGLVVIAAALRPSARDAADREPLRAPITFLAAVLVSALLFTPWLFSALLKETGIAFAELPVMSLKQFYHLHADLVYGPDAGAQSPLWPALLAGLAAVGLLAGLAGRTTRLGALLCGLMVLILPPLIVLILRWQRYFLAVRQVLFLLPFYLLLVSVGTVWIARQARKALVRAGLRLPARVAIPGVMALALLLGLSQWMPALQANYDNPRWNYRDAMAFIDANAGPEDALVAPRQHESFFHYYTPEWVGRVETPATGTELEAIGRRGQALWILTSQTPALPLEMQHWVQAQARVRLDFGPFVRVYFIRPGLGDAELAHASLDWQLPADGEALTDLATFYAGVGLAEPALHAVGQAIQVADDNQAASRASILRARLLHGEGEISQAVASYQEALTYWPENVEALVRLGVLLSAQAQHEEAIPLLEGAVALEPANSWAWWSLANARQRQGDILAAAEGYRTVITLTPAHAAAHCRLGQALAALGDDRAGAASALQRCLALEPEGPDADAARRWLAEWDPTGDGHD